ncbi:hypothetical protein C0995_014978 [Termitomyces sp. Mi166|nr:hypothetical protein C0995_014978 [Termitomyces sp. Mi166\
MQDAWDSFHNALYIAEEGVQDFYDILLNHAQDMAMYSDEFTIWEHFLEGILFNMLMLLICDGRLASEVNTIEEFVAKTKAYETNIKTALEKHLGKVASLAAAHSTKLGTMLDKHPNLTCPSGCVPVKQPMKVARPARLYLGAKVVALRAIGSSLIYLAISAGWREARGTYMTALTDVNKANDEQENEAVEEEAEHDSQNSKETNIEKEHVELEMYENKYYTHDHDSDRKALFALANELMALLTQ